MLDRLILSLQALNFVTASIVIPVTLGSVVLLLPWLRARLKIQVSSEVSDGFAEIFTAISLFFIFIAAASLATVQSFQKDGARIVDQEVSHITSLDRDLMRYGQPEADAMRVSLRKYVNLIVVDEWPSLATGNSSGAVDNAFVELSAGLGNLTVTTERQKGLYPGIVERIDAVAEARSQRIEIANERLPVIYWGSVLSFIGLLAVISFFTHDKLAKRAAMCGKMLAIAFTFVMLVQTDGVFSGDISIKPHGLEKVLRKMIVGPTN